MCELKFSDFPNYSRWPTKFLSICSLPISPPLLLILLLLLVALVFCYSQREGFTYNFWFAVQIIRGAKEETFFFKGIYSFIHSPFLLKLFGVEFGDSWILITQAQFSIVAYQTHPLTSRHWNWNKFLHNCQSVPFIFLLQYFHL